MGISTILLMLFAGMFLFLRVVVAIMTQSGLDLLGMVSWNLTYEIILIFVALVCIVLMAKRKLIGSIIYCASYGYYFGIDLYNRIITMPELTMTSVDIIMNLVVDGIAILLGVSVVLDAIAQRVTKGQPKNRKTEWFFGNEEFDRKFDERADRNEYKF